MIREADMDGDGFVNFKGTAATGEGVTNLGEMTDEEIEEMIRNADMDRDGFVNFKGNDFNCWGWGGGGGGRKRGLMTNLGEKMTDEEMIREADMDGDGFVNFKGTVSIRGGGGG